MVRSIDVAVIGAGAAGMMAAASAAQRGCGVVLIDHAERLAEKIRISGGGRCNFTNLQARAECYLSRNPHFCKSALAQYTVRDFLDLVESYRIGYHEKKLGQLFCDEGSQQIIDLLKSECDKAGVVWRMATPVGAIEQVEHGFRLAAGNEVWDCRSLIIATGGLSIPPIGATGFGYDLARQFGLPIVPTAPALVPLTFEPKDLYADLSGVSIDCEVSLGHASFRENVLFTHKGVSGPAILQISSYWSPGQALSLDLLPGRDARALFAEAARSEVLLPNLLAEWLPKRFAQAFCAAQLDIRPMKQYLPRELELVASRLHDWRVIPSGTVGYKKAEVTRGGVDTAALSSKTMAAKSVPGLFFVGEVVDVTGWLGGYNFQWAWSSGWVAGQNA
ncbi:BaiN/RdsA family NAD(P)/FAD-dependent oxidoreductase [Chitinimonas lacunae]|uniref:NAD(P)/FAD-dependent oxidoreductase n=1 Tax=Chitinimonas lacunae TaxID=1963018 RepID=A0ABV8MT56_9NEIS